jgi:hypothetical protein
VREGVRYAIAAEPIEIRRESWVMCWRRLKESKLASIAEPLPVGELLGAIDG